MKLPTHLLTGLISLASIFISLSTQADNCPVLTQGDLRTVIESGTGQTEWVTLMNVSGLTAEEIKAQEPTANPYDAYYSFTSIKNEGVRSYILMVGPVLGGSEGEARDRASKIFLRLAGGMYVGHAENQVCFYERFMASPEIAGYPFKSRWEFPGFFAVRI